MSYGILFFKNMPCVYVGVQEFIHPRRQIKSTHEA